MSDNPSPSPIGAAVSIAGQTISAFRTEPVLLLIIILNIMMLIATGIVGWAVVVRAGEFLMQQEAFRHEERLMLLQEMSCIGVPKRQPP